MTDITTSTFRTNFKKLARTIQKNDDICYSKAQDRAAKKYKFDSYHALQAYRKSINNESNIVNANLGTDGVNLQYAKAQGNKGKQLNPNQHSSLLVAFNDNLTILKIHKEDGEFISIWENFQTEYLDKGFAKEVGASVISREELERRALPAPHGKPGEYFLHEYDLTCIEFLRDKNNPWSKRDADQLIKNKISSQIGNKYYSKFWLDGKPIDNHIGDEETREAEAMADTLEYCPAIDGY